MCVSIRWTAFDGCCWQDEFKKNIYIYKKKWNHDDDDDDDEGEGKKKRN